MISIPGIYEAWARIGWSSLRLVDSGAEYGVPRFPLQRKEFLGIRPLLIPRPRSSRLSLFLCLSTVWKEEQSRNQQISAIERPSRHPRIKPPGTASISRVYLCAPWNRERQPSHTLLAPPAATKELRRRLWHTYLWRGPRAYTPKKERGPLDSLSRSTLDFNNKKCRIVIWRVAGARGWFCRARAYYHRTCSDAACTHNKHRGEA